MRLGIRKLDAPVLHTRWPRRGTVRHQESGCDVNLWLWLFFLGLIVNMTTHYNRIGGVEMIRMLVTRFYKTMDELPESYGIRRLHPENLQGSEDKLFKYLCGWMGRPALYVRNMAPRCCAAVTCFFPSATLSATNRCCA